MLTQIYEVQSAEAADAVSAIGVDHVGVLVGWGDFPREIGLSQATAVGAAIRPGSRFSALFLGADVALIARMARALAPSILHLGAAPEHLSARSHGRAQGLAARHRHHALDPRHGRNEHRAGASL